MSPRARTTLAAVGVAAAALAAHGGALGHGFVWDDEAVVVLNPDTRDLSALPRVLLSPDERPPYYRPLNRASYLLDHALFGMDPRGFHAVNLALHALAAALLVLLARRLLGDLRLAALAGALLAVHPIAVEAVSFVTARNNLFALVFSLAAALALLRALEERSRPWALASGVAFLLGLLSKEPAGMILPILGAMVMLPRPWTAPRRLLWISPHLVALGVYLALRGISLSGATVPVDPPPAALSDRIAALGWIVPEYLRLLVWPSDPTVFHAQAPTLGLAGRLAAWAGLLALGAWQARRPTATGTFGFLWAALTFAPASGLVAIPASPIAERFAYLPLAGLGLVVADLASRLRLHERARAEAAALAGLVLLALGGRAFVRTAEWRDDVALFSSAARVDPGSRQAWFNLGVARKDAGDLPGAQAAWETLLRIDPDHAEAVAQLGTLYAVRGDLAQAEGLLRRALVARPELEVARQNLALVLERTGRPDEAAVVRAGVPPGR